MYKVDAISPLTKSGSSDSLRLRRFGRVIDDGDGAIGGGSGRPDGDVGGDATLAGTRVLRPAAGTAAGGRFRRVRGAGLQAVLRAEDGRSVAAAGAVFPLVLVARFPAAVEPRQGSRSFVAVAHALASAARGAREGVRLGFEDSRRARPGEGRAGLASTARRWRPMRPCVRSCGATTARATARC